MCELDKTFQTLFNEAGCLKLRTEMKRRRKLQLKEKPPSWETNYGKPTSIRRLKNPVRLRPLNYE
jgi:hypothetical protein